MPKFLVDESTGLKIFQALTEKDYDAKYVSFLMPKASDDEVLAFAEKENRILITDDKDFGELTFRFMKPSSGVVLLRLKLDLPEYRIKHLLNFLEKFVDKLEGNFIVLTEGQVRVRKIN